MSRKKLLAPRHEPVYTEPVWLGVSRSSWVSWIVLAVVVIVFFFVGIIAVLGRVGIGLILLCFIVGLLAILAIASLADVKVLIDSKGIHIRCGAFGRPRRTVVWHQIQSVEMIDVKPSTLGGFGFRWFPIKDGKAIVMRQGPGILINLKDGTRLIVTVDQAKDAVAFAQQFVN